MRRLSTAACLLIALTSNMRAADAIDPAQAKTDAKTNISYYDVRLLGVEGKGWTETKDPFDRLPAKAQGVVRDPVWNLSRHSAGMAVRFATDAPTISARWTLTSPSLSMPHMPATGVSGLDLYVKHAGRWRWIGAGRPTATGVNQAATLVSGLPAGTHQFILYLPLYNGVTSVEVGIPAKNRLEKAEPRPDERKKPIVFWGTSITQGGCASRPGMVHTAILGRRLERPVINLGFSGNGRMEPEMAALVAELDAALYVIECTPNMGAEEVGMRTGPLVQTLRKAHADTPILLVEEPTFCHAYLLDSVKQRAVERRQTLRKVYEQLMKDGVKNLYYLPGDKQFGDDSEAAVDGVHATDLGFLRMADAYEPTLVEILRAANK